MTPGECVRVRVAVPDAPGFCPPSLTVQVSQTKDSLILGEPALGTGCLPKVVGFHPELGLAALSSLRNVLPSPNLHKVLLLHTNHHHLPIIPPTCIQQLANL